MLSDVLDGCRRLTLTISAWVEAAEADAFAEPPLGSWALDLEVSLLSDGDLDMAKLFYQLYLVK